VDWILTQGTHAQHPNPVQGAEPWEFDLLPHKRLQPSAFGAIMSRRG
jgi:hypothetical protein